MPPIRVTELLGDGIGPELREAVHEIVDVLPLSFEFEAIDFSLENREKSDRSLYDAAAESMATNGLALKYPTITKTTSPNAIIRRLCRFSVILRPVFSIPGVQTNFKEDVALYIVRVATGGTYDDPGRRVGRDAAVSVRIVEREPCEHAARFAFGFARAKKLSVTSSSKHTIQRATDGLFQAIVADVHREYPDVPHKVELFDALLAKIVMNPTDFDVILVLNEYGDFLSDMAGGLVGGMGTGASGNFSFDADQNTRIAMFDPAGGTAPDIAGQNKCNPAAMLFAVGMLLDHIEQHEAGHALRAGLLSAIKEGERTADLGGRLGTREFTRTVAQRVAAQLRA